MDTFLSKVELEIDDSIEPEIRQKIEYIHSYLVLGMLDEVIEGINELYGSGHFLYAIMLRMAFHLARDEYDEATEQVDMLGEAYPGNPSFVILKAGILRVSKGNQEAWDFLTREVEKFPSDFELLYTLACLASRMQKYTESVGWLSRALSIHDTLELRQDMLAEPDLQGLRKKIGKKGIMEIVPNT